MSDNNIYIEHKHVIDNAVYNMLFLCTFMNHWVSHWGRIQCHLDSKNLDNSILLYL